VSAVEEWKYRMRSVFMGQNQRDLDLADAAIAELETTLRVAWDLCVGVADADDLDAEYAKWREHMRDVVAERVTP